VKKALPLSLGFKDNIIYFTSLKTKNNNYNYYNNDDDDDEALFPSSVPTD